MADAAIQVLIVENNEDDYLTTRNLFLKLQENEYELERAQTYAEALMQMMQRRHHLYLISYELGSQNGLDLLREAMQSSSPHEVVAQSCTAPIILLGKQADQAIDQAVIEAGGADYWLKPELNERMIARSIRCALQCHRIMFHLRDTLAKKELLTQAMANLATANSSNNNSSNNNSSDNNSSANNSSDDEERYKLAIEGANDGIWDWNLQTNQIYFSSRWKAMLGDEKDSIGERLDDWFDRVHPKDLNGLKRQIKAHVNGVTSHFKCEYRIKHQDGQYRWMLSRGLALRDSSGQATRMAGFQTDMTDWRQAEEKLVHDAFYDTLTSLPNRMLLTERMRHAIHLVQRSPELMFAVLFIDLDRFKVINDSLGHMLGDQLLIAIANRFLHCLRPTDTVARLGGDEFVVLLEEVKDTQSVIAIADRIQHALAQSFNLEGHEVYTAASIGIAFSNLGYERPEDLLRDADTAMYRAKAQGRGRYEIFQPGMHTNAMALLQLETDLRRAIERLELCLHFQPIVSLRTCRVVGVEALVRWQHPQRGLIFPGEFIPLAEETGLIVPIGSWVLREACRQVSEWQSQNPDKELLIVHVNLSGRQFSSGIAEEVHQVLQETQLLPQQLKLEITETVLMANAESAIETLNQLRQLGIQLAIDDFGTGYSSLSYLHRLPIDTLKIDRSFTSKIDFDGEQLAIVRTIITLAWNLGMEVIAEGIETPKQLAQLRALRCEQGQGYFFAKPFASLLTQQPWVQNCDFISKI